MVSRIGFLHPGEMGSALAAVARARGHRVCWAGTGRSAATRARAEASGLEDLATLDALAQSCDAIVGICPPHAALDVARAVAASGFGGLYIDANAIAPATVRSIAQCVDSAGARFADAALVGPPPRSGSRTVLLASGPAAREAMELLAGPGLEAVALGGEAGRASALKLCHSAMHKGQLALHFAVAAAAEREGLLGELEALWAQRPETAMHADLRGKLARAGKSWRFAGEMDEIALMLDAIGLPRGFHDTAADVFRRVAAGPAPITDAASLAQALVAGGRR